MNDLQKLRKIKKPKESIKMFGHAQIRHSAKVWYGDPLDLDKECLAENRLMRGENPDE